MKLWNLGKFWNLKFGQMGLFVFLAAVGKSEIWDMTDLKILCLLFSLRSVFFLYGENTPCHGIKCVGCVYSHTHTHVRLTWRMWNTLYFLSLLWKHILSFSLGSTSYGTHITVSGRNDAPVTATFSPYMEHCLSLSDWLVGSTILSLYCFFLGHGFCHVSLIQFVQWHWPLDASQTLFFKLKIKPSFDAIDNREWVKRKEWIIGIWECDLNDGNWDMKKLVVVNMSRNRRNFIFILKGPSLHVRSQETSMV